MHPESQHSRSCSSCQLPSSRVSPGDQSGIDRSSWRNYGWTDEHSTLPLTRVTYLALSIQSKSVELAKLSEATSSRGRTKSGRKQSRGMVASYAQVAERNPPYSLRRDDEEGINGRSRQGIVGNSATRQNLERYATQGVTSGDAWGSSRICRACLALDVLTKMELNFVDPHVGF